MKTDTCNFLNRYRNLWRKRTNVRGPEFYENNARCILEHRGVMVYHVASHYDFVLGDACISMRAGITNARDVIDEMLNGIQPCSKEVASHITASGFKGYSFDQYMTDWSAGKVA